jgi:integrase
MLKRHRLASPYSQPDDFVFANRDGRGRNYRDVTVRGFNAALTKAGISDEPRKLRFHDLRAFYASLLISSAVALTRVARQLGHSNPGITLTRYARLFDAANPAESVREKVEQRMGWSG